MHADMTDCQERCSVYLMRLRAVAYADAAQPLPPGACDEIGEATAGAVAVIEEATGLVVSEIPDGPRRSATGRFLAARVSRMAAAADDALESAKDSDAGRLRRCAQRFDVLASAFWVVVASI